MSNPDFGAGAGKGAIFSPSVSRGNYLNPGYGADYEERMLFKYRDRLRDQIDSIDAGDPVYGKQAEAIKKNLETLALFVERQIYDNQAYRKALAEMRKDASARLTNPELAAAGDMRKQTRLIASMNGRLNEMRRLLSARPGAGDAQKRDMYRRAMEISVELKYRIEPYT